MENDKAMDVLSSLSISAADLRIGEVYFFVGCSDEAHLVPIVQSLIYIGRNLAGESDGSFYFQDSQSYCVHGPLSLIHI